MCSWLCIEGGLLTHMGDRATEIYGIVLASGQSTRMGRPKLLLPWQGMTVLDHVLCKTISIPFTAIKVVVPGGNEALKRIAAGYYADLTANLAPERGIGHSLSLAVQSLPPSAEAAVILLADQPTLPEKAIRSIVAAFELLYSKVAASPEVIIQTRYRDGRSGHPVLFSRHFFGHCEL